jgi:hypothetical protein
MLPLSPPLGLDPNRAGRCCLVQVLPDESIVELAELIRKYEDSHGLRAIVRFAHEMQGNWFP